MTKLKRPLDKAAVSAADDDFYADHPELVDGDGERIPLDPNDPAQADLREEWREKYVENGGQTASGAQKKPDETVEPCKPHGDGKSGGAAAPADDEKEPVATLTVKWSKAQVTPNHNSSWPPASAPTDTIPEEAKVELIGETTNVPEGTAASITVYQSDTGAALPEGSLTTLKVKGNKVIDPSTGKPPVWVFEAKHSLWNSWDKPYYHFTCDVDHQGLSKTTPKDFKSQAAASLRLIYWHYCVAETSTLAGVLPECNTVAGILNGIPHSKAAIQNLTTVNVSLVQWGSLLRNTYVLHMASHGNVLNRATGAGIPDNDPGETKYTKSQWRSIVHITPTRFGDAEANNAASVPSVPKYLFYSSTCLTGWEPSFANTMIARGTRNVLVFRRTIPDSEAPTMSQKFYNRWVNTYKLEPSKIPECFFKAGADHYKNMKPILYGAGGGSIQDNSLSPLEIAAIAIGVVAAGLLVGYALYKILK